MNDNIINDFLKQKKYLKGGYYYHGCKENFDAGR